MKHLVNNPSELTEVIEFYSEESYQNDDGVMVPGEHKVMTTWAKVLSDLLKDYKTEAGNFMSGKTAFVIRYDQTEDIDTAMIIHWNSQKYKIDTILRDNAYKQYDSIVCIKA